MADPTPETQLVAEPSERPPKSAGEIRSRLASVHALADRAGQPGPYAAGMKATDRLIVATFNDPRCASAYQQRLFDASIHSERGHYRGRTTVLVDLEDRDRAAQVLEAHLRLFPDRRARDRHYYDATLVLTAIGAISATMGVLLYIHETTSNGPFMVRTLLTCIGGFFFALVHFAFVGLFVDLWRGGRFRLARRQFDLGFMLFMVTGFALAIFWWL